MAILRQDFCKTMNMNMNYEQHDQTIYRDIQYLISASYITMHTITYVVRFNEISCELKTMRNSVFSLVSIAGKYKLLHPLLQT